MKKIPVSIVFVLTVLTFGLYFIYWAARNRDYIVKHRKDAGSIPKWGWLLLLPIAISSAIISFMTYTLMGSFDAIPVDEAVTGVMYSFLALVVLPIIIGVWWFWYFGRAIEVITQGRMGRAWTIPLYIFTGPFVILFHQYYINRLDENEKGAAYSASTGLVLLSGAIGLMWALSSISSVMNVDTTVNKTRETIQTSQENYRAFTALNSEHLACKEKLASDYPDGETEENKAAYIQAQQKCDELFKAYQDAYNTFIKVQ